MKFPKLCVGYTLLYFSVCLFSTPLFSQIATPTFETSHGPGPTITVCHNTPITFSVPSAPANAFFQFFVSQMGKSTTVKYFWSLFGPNYGWKSQFKWYFFAEIIYSQSQVTTATQTASITVDYFPAPVNLSISTNLSNSFYCSNTPVEITAAGADFYEFFLDGILQGASSATDLIMLDLLRGATIVTVGL